MSEYSWNKNVQSFYCGIRKEKAILCLCSKTHLQVFSLLWFGKREGGLGVRSVVPRILFLIFFVGTWLLIIYELADWHQQQVWNQKLLGFPYVIFFEKNVHPKDPSKKFPPFTSNKFTLTAIVTNVFKLLSNSKRNSSKIHQTS